MPLLFRRPIERIELRQFATGDHDNVQRVLRSELKLRMITMEQQFVRLGRALRCSQKATHSNQEYQLLKVSKASAVPVAIYSN